MNARSEASAQQRVVWITNVAAPYRRPVWDAIAESIQLTVLLLENQTRFRRGGTNRGSEWAEYDESPYDVAEVPTARLTRGEGAYYLALRLGFLAKYRPDAVLLAGWESPAYWQALLWCKLRGVRTVGFYESTLSTQHFRRGPIAAARRLFFKLLDRVVVPGVAARDAVLEMGVDASRVDVGFNAVDVERIAARTESARADLAEALEASGHRFLYLGQLIERKNVGSLLEAFRIIAEPQDSLTVAGAGMLEEALRTRAHALSIAGQVRFPGLIAYAQLPELFAAHDTLVLPSTEEVWGLVVNEALAAGLHVVVTDTAGVARSVEHMAAVYISDSSPSSIGRAMEQSRNEWQGPVKQPEILTMTPRRFAAVFSRAVRSDKSPRRRRANGP